MQSRIGVAILVLAFLTSPAGADQCRVTIDIPETSAGAMLTLNSVLYEVGTEASWVVYTAQPVTAGETLIATVPSDPDVEGPSKEHDYTLENVLGVSYPSGQTVLVEWDCPLAGEWVGVPGCLAEWIE